MANGIVYISHLKNHNTNIFFVTKPGAAFLNQRVATQ